jgi:hypothetical protein
MNPYLNKKLDKMLRESRCAEIYTFIKLLDALGFQVAIRAKAYE